MEYLKDQSFALILSLIYLSSTGLLYVNDAVQVIKGTEAKLKSNHWVAGLAARYYSLGCTFLLCAIGIYFHFELAKFLGYVLFGYCILKGGAEFAFGFANYEKPSLLIYIFSYFLVVIWHLIWGYFIYTSF